MVDKRKVSIGKKRRPSHTSTNKHSDSSTDSSLLKYVLDFGKLTPDQKRFAQVSQETTYFCIRVFKVLTIHCFILSPIDTMNKEFCTVVHRVKKNVLLSGAAASIATAIFFRMMIILIICWICSFNFVIIRKLIIFINNFEMQACCYQCQKQQPTGVCGCRYRTRQPQFSVMVSYAVTRSNHVFTVSKVVRRVLDVEFPSKGQFSSSPSKQTWKEQVWYERRINSQKNRQMW